MYGNFAWENNGTDSFSSITAKNFKVHFGYGNAVTIHWHAVGRQKQWGRANNNQSKSFALNFSTVYAAVCVGYENNTPDVDDGAPRVKMLSTSAITTNTGYNHDNTTKVSMFIAIGK